MRRLATLVTLVACTSWSIPVTAGAQQRPQQDGSALVLEGVTVVDVARAANVPNQRVVIRGDTIVSVEAAGGPGVADEALRVDGRGLWVIPGIVDHHTHLGPGMDEALERALRGGVTLVETMAGDTRTDGEYQRRVLAGELDGPEISYASVMAGPAFHEDPRFQGAALGYAPGKAPWMQAVTAETDPLIAVAAAKGTGAEVLKLYAMMEAPVVSSLTAEAHRQGLRVVAHGTVFPARPSELVAAGVDVLTHAAYLSWEGAPSVRDTDSWDRKKGPYATVRPDGPEITSVLEAMARRRTALEPTLWVFQQGDDVDTALVAWAEAVTRRAFQLGVPILAGTDGLIGDGRRALPNIHGEMAALVRAGLSPAQALAAATVTPARIMGREATHGAVAPGHVADLVLLTADPLVAIEATREIRWVVRKGHLIDVGR